VDIFNPADVPTGIDWQERARQAFRDNLAATLGGNIVVTDAMLDDFIASGKDATQWVADLRAALIAAWQPVGPVKPKPSEATTTKEFAAWWNSKDFRTAGELYAEYRGRGVSEALFARRSWLFGYTRKTIDQFLQDGIVPTKEDWARASREASAAADVNLEAERLWAEDLYDQIFHVPKLTPDEAGIPQLEDDYMPSGWAHQEAVAVTGVPLVEDAYEKQKRLFDGFIDQIERKHGQVWDILSQQTLAQQELQTFIDLAAQAHDGDVDGLADALMVLQERDDDLTWIVDGTDGVSGFLQWWGGWSPNSSAFVADVTAKYDEMAKESADNQSAVDSITDQRVRDLEIGLGRKLTSEEGIVAKQYEKWDTSLASAYPELGKAYTFFETGGVGSSEVEARAAWDRYLKDPSVPNEIKGAFTDFNDLWTRYQTFSKNAFARARQSDSLTWETLGQPLGADDIVPYTVWDFDDFLRYQSAWESFGYYAQLGEGTDLSEIKDLLLTQIPTEADRRLVIENLTVALEAQGITGDIFSVPPGYTYAEYYDLMLNVMGNDLEAVEALIGVGFVSPSTTAVLQDIQGTVVANVKQMFLPRVEPGRRAQFMDELMVQLPTLYSRFEQIVGALQTTPGNIAGTAAAIAARQQQFADWMQTQDFFQTDTFLSLEQQEAAMPRRFRYIPTQWERAQPFGIGR